MDNFTVLIDFLGSTLPAALVTKAIAFVPIVNALVGLLRGIPAVEENKRVAGPVAAVALGLFFGCVTVNFDMHQYLVALGAGVLIGLSAIGGFSSVKNLAQTGK